MIVIVVVIMVVVVVMIVVIVSVVVTGRRGRRQQAARSSSRDASGDAGLSSWPFCASACRTDEVVRRWPRAIRARRSSSSSGGSVDLVRLRHRVEQQPDVHPPLGLRAHLAGEAVPVDLHLLDVDALAGQTLGVLAEQTARLLLDHSLGQLDRVALAQLLEHRLLLARAHLVLLLVPEAIRHVGAQAGEIGDPRRRSTAARHQLADSLRQRVVERRQVALGDLGDLDAEAAHPGLAPSTALLLAAELGLLADLEPGEREAELLPYLRAADLDVDRLGGPHRLTLIGRELHRLDRDPVAARHRTRRRRPTRRPASAGWRAPRRPRQSVGTVSVGGRSKFSMSPSWIGGRTSTVATKISGSPLLSSTSSTLGGSSGSSELSAWACFQ